MFVPSKETMKPLVDVNGGSAATALPAIGAAASPRAVRTVSARRNMGHEFDRNLLVSCMMRAVPDQTSYTFGDSQAAAERLALVARVFEPPSRRFLADAAAGAGLAGCDLAVDLGCGPGHST